MNNLEEILAHNARFVGTSVAATEIRPETRKRLAVVTCIDPRLTDFMADALGLKRGDAIFIRVAGPTFTHQDTGLLRSLAVAVTLNNVEDILVIGHTDCRLMSETLPLINALQGGGVSRDAFGSEDLRNWFGLFHNPEENVRAVVRQLRESPVIPKKAVIHGLMIDTVTGKLSVVVQHQQAEAAKTQKPPEPPPPKAPEIKQESKKFGFRVEEIQRPQPPAPKKPEVRKVPPRTRDPIDEMRSILKKLDRR